jgi:hypothetical protein
MEEVLGVVGGDSGSMADGGCSDESTDGCVGGNLHKAGHGVFRDW